MRLVLAMLWNAADDIVTRGTMDGLLCEVVEKKKCSRENDGYFRVQNGDFARDRLVRALPNQDQAKDGSGMIGDQPLSDEPFSLEIPNWLFCAETDELFQKGVKKLAARKSE